MHRHQPRENRTAARRRDTDLRTRAERVGQAQRRRRPIALHDRSLRLSRSGRSGLFGRRYPARRGRLGRSAPRAGSRPHVRPQHPEIHDFSHQVDRSGRHGRTHQNRHPRRTRQTRRRYPVRSGEQSRISERGCSHQGFHVARPRGGGHRKRTRPQNHDAALSPVPDQPFPCLLHGHSVG